MKLIFLICVVIAATAAGQESNLAGRAATVSEAQSQSKCPVMEGRLINKRLYVDYKGFRMYVCCNACVKAARKNPEKFFKRLQEQGIALEKVPQDKTNNQA